MNKKKIQRKAYCGDGLLRYCLGKIFIRTHNSYNHYIDRLASNKTLKNVVFKNVDEFPIVGASSEWEVGTVYEARLYDISEKELFGLEACVRFVRKTYGIGKYDTPKSIYIRLHFGD